MISHQRGIEECEDVLNQDEADCFTKQILALFPEPSVDISNKDLGQIIMFIRHSMFLPENQKMAELKQMIIRAFNSAQRGER